MNVAISVINTICSKTPVFAALLGLAVLSASCAPGSGDGLDANGRPLGEGGGGGPLTAEFASIQANVFTPSCATAGCHVGAAAPQGLRLDDASSYAMLVGIPSNQIATLLRVDPSNPDNSYLIQKLEGTAAVGGRMPLNGPPYLDQTTVDFIRQWISDGAAPPVTNVAQPPQVVSVDPAAATSVDQLPTNITVIFTQDMDGSLLSSATVIVTRSGGDATFGDGNEEVIQAADISLDAANLRLAIIDLAGVTSVEDSYEIRLVGSGATALASLAGDVLDGDGDGQAGGDFVSTFSVAGVSSTLQSIQDDVFTPSCSSAGCHSGPAGPGLPSGQDLSSVAASFASLVNVPSVQDPNILRVSPGDANNSYLVLKLEGTAASGSQMPLGGAPLSQLTIDSVRGWIDAGASNGSSDISPPTVNLLAVPSPVTGSVLLSATAQDDAGVAQVSFLIDGVSIGSVSTAPYELMWVSSSVADGDHEIVAEARDLSGNVAVSASQTVTTDNDVDSTPPEVALNAITSPVAGTVIVSATATDDTGVVLVEFFVDGALVASDASSPFEYQWNTSNLANADYELMAAATDGAGNSTDSAQLTVTVLNDSQSPTVSITSPEDGDDVSGQVLVVITANDDVGIADVALLVDGVVAGMDTTAPYEIIWNTTVLADERYDLVARATDTAGNSTDSEIVRADVDNSECNDAVPPTINVTAPAAGSVAGTVTVSASASDDVGVTLVSFFAGGQLIGTDAISPYDLSWDTTAVANGTIDITANATDGCNTTTSAPVTVTVDNAATQFAVSALTPVDGAIETNFPTAITATFTSNVSAATVSPTTFVVERSGGDGTFGDGNEVRLIEAISASGNQAGMNLANIFPAFEDTYRVTLSDTITDNSGTMLDGDNDGTAGGDFVATFDTDLTTYIADTQPIFQQKCDTCHTGDGNGDHNIGTVYGDALRPADDGACSGRTVGECTIVLIQRGDMPLGGGCSGNPAQDAGNASCLTAAEQSAIQDWIDDRLPE